MKGAADLPPAGGRLPAARNLHFWVVRLLITVGGAAGADYLAQVSPVLAAVAGTGLLAAGLAWQFRVRRYAAAAYWFLVCAVVIAGTGLSDFLHLAARLPYAVTALLWAAALTAVLAAWYRDPELTVATVVTRRREAIYWAMVFTSFAFGAALADFAATTVNLGYASASLVFLAAAVAARPEAASGPGRPAAAGDQGAAIAALIARAARSAADDQAPPG